MRHHRITVKCRAFTTILLVVCALAPARSVRVLAVNGSWFLGLSVEPGSPPALETQFDLELSSEQWDLALGATFEGSDWDELKFETDGTIGDLTVDSELVFEPDRNRWKHWQTEIEWVTGSMTLGVTSKLSRTTDWLTLEMEQESEFADVETRLRLRAPTGSCVFAFYDADLGVAFTWCEIDSEIALAFDDDGFDELVLEWSDVTLARFPWVLFDVEVVIDLAGWEIEVDPMLGLAIEGCLEIEIEAALPGFPQLAEVREVEIVGSWKCGPWETDATIRLDPDDWIDDLYWLEVEADLEIDLTPCGELAATFLLDWTETALGRIGVETAYSPTDRISFGCDATRDLETGRLEEVTLALEFAW
jgi:hypothetical protein